MSEQQVAESPAPTMEETMEAAFDKAEGLDHEGPAEETAQQETPEETPAEAQAETEQIEEGEAQAEPEEAQAETVEPPASWTKEAKSKFSELPDWAQAEVLKREGDFEKGIAKHADKAKNADEFSEVVAPYAAMIAAEGGTPARAFGSLLQTAAVFRTGSPQQKAHTIQQLIQQFGVDMSLLSQDETMTDQNPDITALRQQVSNLEHELVTQKTTTQNAKIETANNLISEFAKEHEHFDTVKDEMGLRIQSGKAKDLQEAYDQALWVNPETRKEMLAKQKADEEKKREAENKEAVKKAKKTAGTQLKSDGGTGTKPVKAKSIEDTMSDAYDRAMAS